MNIVVATSRPWNEHIADKLREQDGLAVTLIKSREELNISKLQELNPSYVFFPHWSHIIPKDIYENFDCVIFHMTDLPFGRGGSPLQNLILRGIRHTRVSALRCSETLDGGPVYLKRPLSLDGNAREIFERCSFVIHQMIVEIVQNNIKPEEQHGAPTVFTRRHPRESNIYGITDMNLIFDHIRMLDAEGYPRAFIENELVKYEFSDATFAGEEITAKVRITRKKDV